MPNYSLVYRSMLSNYLHSKAAVLLYSVGKSLTNFDDWQSIRQNFPTNFSSQCISYEGYHQFVKVLLVKVLVMSIRQISSHFSTVKVLRYTVYTVLIQILWDTYFTDTTNSAFSQFNYWGSDFL